MGRVSGSKLHDKNPSFHRPRKREVKEVDVKMSKKPNTSGNNMWAIDKLSDDLLIDVLSRLSIKEAARASVLSRRWRHLWKYTYGTLEFDATPNCKGIETNIMKFKSSVDNVVKVHKGSKIDAFIVRFNLYSGVKCHAVDRWIHFAMRKQPKVFELRLELGGVFSNSQYVFPNIEELSLHSHDFTTLSNSLTTLRLIGLSIMDNMVHWFLASCPNLEHLCISKSRTTKNVQIVDPLPKLKSLEISECPQIESLEISVASLISCTYGGNVIDTPFKNTPNLTELTLGGKFCNTFLNQPNQHTSYSGQLVKLVLDLQSVVSTLYRIVLPDPFPQLHSLEHLEVKTTYELGYNLHFFTLLIQACPLLQEFRIEMDYERFKGWGLVPFPRVYNVPKFSHQSLKLVEMSGFVGCLSENDFLSRLSRRAPFLEQVIINTTTTGYDEEATPSFIRRESGVMPKSRKARRAKAKEDAEKMRCKLPSRVKLVII